MTQQWDAAAIGVIELPSGRLIRGRGLRNPAPDGPTPTLAVHLTGRLTDAPPWDRLWIQWRDFWLPSDPDEALRTLRRAYDNANSERVEIACGGGVGRTGTGLATMCVFEGMAPDAAVNWVREHYNKRSIELRWQRRLLLKAWAAQR